MKFQLLSPGKTIDVVGWPQNERSRSRSRSRKLSSSSVEWSLFDLRRFFTIYFTTKILLLGRVQVLVINGTQDPEPEPAAETRSNKKIVQNVGRANVS
jgi:hypothetical protein